MTEITWSGDSESMALFWDVFLIFLGGESDARGHVLLLYHQGP